MAIAPSTRSSSSSKETRSARRSPLAPSHEYSLCSVNQWRSASLQILFSGFQRRGHSRGWAPLTRCPGRCPGTQGSSPRPMREQNQGHHGAPWVTTGQQCIGSNQDETHNSENQIESIVWLLSTYSMSLLQSLRTWGMVRNISVDSILSYEDTNEYWYVLLHNNFLYKFSTF